MLDVGSLPSAPYPLAWLVAVALEAQAKLRGRSASINRRVLHSLSSDNSFSNRKARDLLGWTPRVGLDEGMRRTEEWLRKQGLLQPGRIDEND
ncbi:MAG: hypothetical protein HC802_09375 [Caldilineaceae bacterium]|nr:hypothetical protein [Caldilineaceae bacterium]